MNGSDGTTRDIALLVVSVALMLAGAAMLIAGLNAGVALPVIAVGIALTVILQGARRRRAGAGR